MIIERNAREIVFRLPLNTKLKDLQEIANLFTYNDIASKSKASQKEVDNLVSSIKKGRWKKTKETLHL